MNESSFVISDLLDSGCIVPSEVPVVSSDAGKIRLVIDLHYNNQFVLVKKLSMRV